MATKKEFEIRSLTGVRTFNTDNDVGVVRVSPDYLSKASLKRNALVRISSFDEDNKKSNSIVRIVRPTSGKGTLKGNAIALQYDDRLELGITKVGETHTLEIKQVNDWWGLPCFLLGHASPLVRREAVFSVALMILGVVIGLVAGIITATQDLRSFF